MKPISHHALRASAYLSILLAGASGLSKATAATDVTDSYFETHPLIDDSSLREGFAEVPAHAKMRVYWFWLAGQATKESITQDLEAMKAKGIVGALVLDCASHQTPQGPVFMSEEWQELWAHVIRESTRLGIEISLNIQSGAGDPGNPNIADDNGLKKIVHAQTTVSGPSKVELKLPMPPANKIFYEDVAVQAFKIPGGKVASDEPSWIWAQGENWAMAAVGSRFFRRTFQVDPQAVDTTELWITADNECTAWINGQQVLSSDDWKSPVRISVKEQLKSGTNVMAVEVFNSAEGAAGLIAELVIRGADGTSRKVLSDGTWHSSKEAGKGWTTAANHPAGWKSASVIGPRATQPWAGLSASFQTSGGSAQAAASALAGNSVPAEAILDLSANFDEGVLRWEVPAGDWVVIRYGMTSTGKRNNYAARGYRGGLCYDQMNERGILAQYHDVIEPLIEIAKKNGTSLKYLHSDSWEMGPCDWTQGFEAAFKERRGYDMAPYMPVLAGHTVESPEVSARFLEDFRLTISDLIIEDNYKVFKGLAHKHGIALHSESAGPHQPPVDGLRILAVNDVPMGEAWARSNTHRASEPGRMHVALGASAAHIYGKRFLAAESPTSVGPKWERSPNEVKNVLDRIFCKGVNRINWHTYDSTPDEFGLPGIAYFAGTHLNRKVTWWEESKDFIAYINRTQHMLSQGLHVADVLGYLGSRVPLFATLHRQERSDVPAGYAWDMCNADAFLSRASVQDKRIVMPDGKSYALFALSQDEPMHLPLLRKIESMVKQGMVLVGNPPQRPFGLVEYPESDGEFEAIVKRLWGGADGSSPVVREYGQGRIYVGQPVSRVLEALGIGPDLAWEPREGVDLEYIHHTSLDGELDVYYVINKWAREGFTNLNIYRYSPSLPDRFVNVTASFRVAGDRVVERWDPVSGTITPVRVYEKQDGRYRLPLSLEPEGGAFYVFRKAPPEGHVTGIRRDGEALREGNAPLEVGASSAYLRPDALEVMEPGRYELTRPDGAAVNLGPFTVPAPLDLSTDWRVDFLERPQLGEPFGADYDTLRSWTESGERREKYFSGTARYSRSFTLDRAATGPEHRVYLDLGYVGDMATVRVNGQQVGVLWKAPYMADLTDYVRPGDNRIEVDVTNLWINRLIGDAQLPPAERKTNAPGMKMEGLDDGRLRVSGLIGPVQLKFSSQYSFLSPERHAAEYHVSAQRGSPAGNGSEAQPFETISAAAERAGPGDTITVHTGVYREAVNPPRGGDSDSRRITYRAAEGAEVTIKGSESAKGWVHVGEDTWKLTLPDTFFGDFNPFKQVISGDWFDPRGRTHLRGAVYVDEHWMKEAASLDEVLQPQGKEPFWHSPLAAEAAPSGYLLNLAWLEPAKGDTQGERYPAAQHSDRSGPRNAVGPDGVECVGWIQAGDWLKYADFDFGQRTEIVSLSVSSATAGGRIELRAGQPDGELLGECVVKGTGDWTQWQVAEVEIKPSSGREDLYLVFRPLRSAGGGESDQTVIYAQFKGIDPNRADVEISSRETCFYPRQPGIDYITVRGFRMMHASPPWAPPTAEQVGLVGTHWSRGWIIEDNEILYSKCVGITLGKYGDEWDNRSQSANAYNRTIERALENGWSRENIGHHIVRNNLIAHCEQAGIVGSMGAVFSEISDNVIHDINQQSLFRGAEIGGIKFHGAIDTLIRGNHVYRSSRYGIWLDWMTQGTRVSGNLVHDNGEQDLFLEVNHGPVLVDNNIFLSPRSFKDWAQGSAYVNNLFAGRFAVAAQGRKVPYHKAHSTEIVALHNIPGGDNRYFNNLLVHPGELKKYQPFEHMELAANAAVQAPKLVQTGEGFYLEFTVADLPQGEWVTTERLGRTQVSDLPFLNPDASPVRIDSDYLGRPRNEDHPSVGPFEGLPAGTHRIKVWPL